MEKEVKIDTRDGHTIYGTLNIASNKNNKLVIFVHGLTGHPNEHTFYNASRQFPSKGVDVFRFNLYTGEKGGRKLSECTITTHAQDLNTVVSHFRDKYKTIAGVGHSLGSPTMLKSDFSQFDSIVLWDPSYLAGESSDMPRKANVDGKEVYIEEWGTEYLLNPDMLTEWLWFNGKNELELVRNIESPLKVIAAGEGILKQGAKEYYNRANSPKDFVVIDGAGHTFDEEGAEEKLLKETLEWVTKH